MISKFMEEIGCIWPSSVTLVVERTCTSLILGVAIWSKQPHRNSRCSLLLRNLDHFVNLRKDTVGAVNTFNWIKINFAAFAMLVHNY